MIQYPSQQQQTYGNGFYQPTTSNSSYYERSSNESSQYQQTLKQNDENVNNSSGNSYFPYDSLVKITTEPFSKGLEFGGAGNIPIYLNKPLFGRRGAKNSGLENCKH